MGKAWIWHGAEWEWESGVFWQWELESGSGSENERAECCGSEYERGVELGFLKLGLWIWNLKMWESEVRENDVGTEERVWERMREVR